MTEVRLLVMLGAVELASLGACASSAAVPPLTPEAKELRVGKSDPDPGCREMQPIEVSHGDGCGSMGERGSYLGAYNMLHNVAVELGADYVRMDSQVQPHSENGCFDNKYVIRAVAYRCL
jgi:hypothetical protein